MRRLKLSTVTVSIGALVGVFLLALTLAAASLIWHARKTALAESEAKAVLFVSGAAAALNRSLLGVDVLLASMDDLLGLSGLMVDWIDTRTASQTMYGAMQQNMMVRYVALINAQGRVMASSDPGGAQLVVSLPAGFLDEVLTQPVSALTVSAPVVSFASSERVLYFGRPIKLADGAKVAVVAEVQVPLLTSIMIQGVDISGLEVTLERGNGQLLASVPPQEQLVGTQLSPALGVQRDSAHALRLPARLGGTPAMVVTRPILYRDMLIAASIPIDAALEEWRTQRNFMVGATLVFVLMVLAAGGFAVWYLDRLAQARIAMAQSKATLDQALESMVNGFVLLNAEYQVVSWNRRFVEIYPWTARMLAPLLPFRRLLEVAAKHHLPGLSEAELRNWVERRMALQLNPQAPHEQTLPNGRFIQITERRTPDSGLVIVYHDVTELRVATAEVEQLAFYDALTRLPNRRLLMDRLQHALASSARSGQHGALLFLDLDHFKTLNDTLGHDVGDLLLQQVAQRLRTCVRDEDTVARLGGDEFVIMLENLSEHSHEAATLAQRIGEKILQLLNQPYQLALHTYHSTPSIGATLFGVVQQAPADLLKQADIAMYQVKSRGRNALCFFDPQMQAAITARAQLEEDLHAALLAGQFELHYQPQFKHGERVVGAEVLIRWRHPLRGMVSPVEFIPVAEESELIMSIGHWVLRTACQQLAVWQNDDRCRALHLSVNVSARQFRQPDFVAQVAAVIHATGIRPHLLQLELTESLVLVNVNDTIAKMSALKALGVQFSVDDFGTGYSSLAYLTSLPLDQLKIDQSFVRNIGIKPTDGVIVQTIIGMARNLDLEVIAEGVETQAQQEFLARHGCILYQGYLFGKPTPLADFEALLG
ncbi:bifunctional diguanylate cyclase/phosphodiesterase [Rhodoferax sp. UBA5149]|uniref:bifunctional diguanylate cyclase/phosphodiesterase n=1 Tax=Rhodoferax sp. UBA5149 TaxID=1947379 RepID=UPI0039C931BF